MIAEADGFPTRRAGQARKRPLAILERRAGEVVPVEVEEVEDEIDQSPVTVALEDVLQRLKAGRAIRLDDHDLTVEQRGLRRQRRGRLRDLGETIGPVLAGAREEPHAAALDPAEDAVAVELDLMQPLVAF